MPPDKPEPPELEAVLHSLDSVRLIEAIGRYRSADAGGAALLP